MSDPGARLNAAREGRYAIERELGEGGVATVWLADDLNNERKAAGCLLDARITEATTVRTPERRR